MVEILDNAIVKLKGNTGFDICVSDTKLKKSGIITILSERFLVDVKPEISRGNKGIMLSQLVDASREENLPILLFTHYIPSDIAKEYIDAGINYADTAGNCYIRSGSLSIIIQGKRIRRNPRVNQARAFQETGVKVIFQLLVNPENGNKPYRELAKMADVSLGSVSQIFKELEELNFILRTKKQKLLKNKPELLKRWIVAYHDIVRPKLLLKRMDYIYPEDFSQWQHLLFDLTDENITLWGNENAGALLTKQFNPALHTIYTNISWQNVSRNLKLRPAQNGRIEILRLPYSPNLNDEYANQTVHPLLVYADLMGSSDSRNIETAKLVYEQYLQHIK
ncbi:MAG TPA: type IV toxin-antitoxin system AbiEi family antitoxin [Bacteroidales bacterium]|nr:MAG: hypothetical protein BWX62_00127 [Bacteroidetes bacterium ADurb.Bin037]HPV87613.1 type IV toxin-antitoxin system AbiEi family antitoxin [Bacteroidales bacterium]HPW77909.1 type IV toxin-antitoxin system AbiEi family antitoxin [Bacteroidales bacterium]HQB55367.1 type IV toxin-antitoxin system AbiEi family antitoxin [Bacteroidales bacterium]